MPLEDLPRWEHWMMLEQQWHAFDGPYDPKPSADEVAGMIASDRGRIEGGELARPTPSARHRQPRIGSAEGTVSPSWASRETARL